MRAASIAVVGLGQTGRRLAEAFTAISGCELRWLCDVELSAREEMRLLFGGARTTGDLEQVLKDPKVDAVVIATPALTHASLARRALNRGKHVFVEKPLAINAEDARALASLALDERLLLMAGHSLLFHPAVLKMKELIETGELGRVFYIYGNRQNLGQVTLHENVLWNLAPHDVPVIIHLLDELPVEVSAHGDGYLRRGVPDVVYCYLRFASGISAHLHLSWLDPQKLRRLTVVGSNRMAVFDDTEADRKLTIYEKAAIPRRTDGSGHYMQVRSGGIFCPKVASADPLRLQCEHFVRALTADEDLNVGTAAAVGVVAVLAALQESLDHAGAVIALERPRPQHLRVLLPGG